MIKAITLVIVFMFQYPMQIVVWFQYAHKLAQLVGQNIHKEPSAELSDRLFFL